MNIDERACVRCSARSITVCPGCGLCDFCHGPGPKQECLSALEADDSDDCDEGTGVTES